MIVHHDPLNRTTLLMEKGITFRILSTEEAGLTLMLTDWDGDDESLDEYWENSHNEKAHPMSIAIVAPTLGNIEKMVSALLAYKDALVEEANK